VSTISPILICLINTQQFTKFNSSNPVQFPIIGDSVISHKEYSIFDIAEYAIGYGYTSLAFSRNFLPLIQDLHADYTRLKLAETLRLKSFASIRIYEKLMQYRQADDSGVIILFL
jgi:hypothetical protein